MRHFNHARRGRALAAISGKVPSVSGVCVQRLVHKLNKIPLKRDASGPEGYSDTSGLY